MIYGSRIMIRCGETYKKKFTALNSIINDAMLFMHWPYDS